MHGTRTSMRSEPARREALVQSIRSQVRFARVNFFPLACGQTRRACLTDPGLSVQAKKMSGVGFRLKLVDFDSPRPGDESPDAEIYSAMQEILAEERQWASAEPEDASSSSESPCDGGGSGADDKAIDMMFRGQFAPRAVRSEAKTKAGGAGWVTRSSKIDFKQQKPNIPAGDSRKRRSGALGLLLQPSAEDADDAFAAEKERMRSRRRVHVQGLRK